MSWIASGLFLPPPLNQPLIAGNLQGGRGGEGGSRGRGNLRNRHFKNTYGSRLPQIAIWFTLGSTAARQPSHFAFPQRQARPSSTASLPARPAVDFLALLTVLPTNCKYNSVYWVLGNGYITGTTLRNTWSGGGGEGRGGRDAHGDNSLPTPCVLEIWTPCRVFFLSVSVAMQSPTSPISSRVPHSFAAKHWRAGFCD